MFIHGKGFKRPNGDDLTDLTYDFSKVKVLMFLECVLQLSYNIKRSAATAKLSSSIFHTFSKYYSRNTNNLFDLMCIA